MNRTLCVQNNTNYALFVYTVHKAIETATESKSETAKPCTELTVGEVTEQNKLLLLFYMSTGIINSILQ